MEERVLLWTHYSFDKGPSNPPTSILIGPEFMASKFYQLSLHEELTLALSLIRPCHRESDVDLLLKETAVTNEKYGSVYIICDQDEAIKVDLQKWMIERNPVDEVKLITGSDHTVMFSKPKELCSYLEEIVQKLIL